MIPTYQRIAPAEHAIGKPVTQSLMDRMRRNPLAILGIDEDDEAPFLRMSGMIDYEEVSQSVTSPGGVASEVTGVATVIGDGMEWIESFQAKCHGFDEGDHGKVMDATLTRMRFAYSLNVPTFIYLRGSGTATEGTPINLFPDVSLPVDGAFHTIMERNVNLSLSARAAIVAGKVMLTLRLYGVSGSNISMSWVRRFYRSKGQP